MLQLNLLLVPKRMFHRFAMNKSTDKTNKNFLFSFGKNLDL